MNQQKDTCETIFYALRVIKVEWVPEEQLDHRWLHIDVLLVVNAINFSVSAIETEDELTVDGSDTHVSVAVQSL